MKAGKLGQRSQELLYVSLSKALSSATSSRQLHKVHSLIITLGLDQSVFFSGKLISKYAQFKDPVGSLSVFRRVSPANSLKQDTYTFPSVINACAGLFDLEMGRIVHNHVLEMGFGSDLYIGNALIDMYSRFNDLDMARHVFDEMASRDVVSWNSLISGYSSNGFWEEAIQLFHQSRMVGVIPDSFTVSGVLPACGDLVAVEGQIVHGLVEKMGIKKDVIVSNGLLSMYFKFNRLTDCKLIFSEMVVRDTVSWNTVICGYSQSGLFEESIKLFLEMVNNFEPDLLTIGSVLRACGQIGDLELGKYVHDYMIRNGYECDTTASNILINMYAKCGNLLASREVFDRIRFKDLVSWNSLISGYIQNECFEEAMKLLSKMKVDLRADSVTYVMLLSMSGQLVRIHHGKEVHCDIIKMGFDSSLVVGNALIDMYAKCGKLEDSLKQFENMRDRDIVTITIKDSE
ncbi:hypothetical protein CsSME_00011989 [Camellia sinensis var. sinensis]